jgi:hypothetical protein
MKEDAIKFGKLLPLCFFTHLFFCPFGAANAQSVDIRWLCVTDLQEPINSIGANYESEYGNLNQNDGNFFTWPAQYGAAATQNDQNTLRMEGTWIGVKDYNDPVAGKVLIPKVVGSGPRNDPSDRVLEIFPVDFKLVGKHPHPAVTVNHVDGSFLTPYDQVDEYDPNMAADRMVIVKFNTSIGITVTKKVMVFATPNDGSYFINDYVFKNTGVYDSAGDVKQQILDSTWFYFVYRYAFAGEGNGAASETLGGSFASSTWASFGSTWGSSTLNHDFGDYGMGAQAFNNASSPYYQMRGFYSYYGPDNSRIVTYDGDWGCPAQTWDGRMCSWKFAGNVTLHADKSASDASDDISQPSTTWFIGSDLNPDMEAVNQYDTTGMSDRWTDMTEGHPPLPHDTTVQIVVGSPTPYEAVYADRRRNEGGGTSQGQGYGPYTLAPGDSIQIVFAQAVSGISREKNLEVGANWLQYYAGTGTPNLIMPDGSQAPKTLDGANAYKKAWVFTGRDSLMKTFRNAMKNYASGYNSPLPPPPPDTFTVSSDSIRIDLQWSENAETSPHFNGYVIYRSTGYSMNPLSSYEKIWECDKTTLPATDTSTGRRSFVDISAHSGLDYYYYIQSKDDGTQNLDEPGVPLYSSLFWTVGSQFSVTSVKEQMPKIPNRFELSQNYPNPFNPSTIISYQLSAVSHVSLKIYDVLGREVETLVNERQTAGSHSVAFNAASLPSGVYLYRIQAGSYSKTMKLLLLK